MIGEFSQSMQTAIFRARVRVWPTGYSCSRIFCIPKSVRYGNLTAGIKNYDRASIEICLEMQKLLRRGLDVISSKVDKKITRKESVRAQSTIAQAVQSKY